MTWEQWLFEYKALIAKEHREAEIRHHEARAQFFGLRDLLIGLLGLNILGPKTPAERAEDEAAGRDPDWPKYVGLANLVGSPEVLQHFYALAKRTSVEDGSMTDDRFEQFSEQLHRQLRGEPTEIPERLFKGITAERRKPSLNDYWESQEALAAMRAVGVVERPSTGAVPHIALPKAKRHDVAPTGGVLGVPERRTVRFDGPPDATQTPMSADELAKFRAALEAASSPKGG